MAQTRPAKRVTQNRSSITALFQFIRLAQREYEGKFIKPFEVRIEIPQNITMLPYILPIEGSCFGFTVDQESVDETEQSGALYIMVRKSLTHYVKKGHAQEEDYFGTSHVKFRAVKQKALVNAYPGSLGKRRLWGLMGTFTDYMIRKMFRDGIIADDAEIISEVWLISEVTMNQLEPLFEGTEIPEQVRERIRTDGDEWIQHYRELEWREAVRTTFLMSQIDSVLRARRISRIHELDEEEVEGIREYLENVESWLRGLFSDAQRVVLNPTLGHPDICKADADIIVDDTLYEIKTVKRPREYIKKDKDQLLGYVALAFYHQKCPTETSPSADGLNSVGFLFPQSLLHIKTSIDNFTAEDKLSFIKKVLMLQVDEVLPPPRQRREESRIQSLVKAGRLDEAQQVLLDSVKDGTTTFNDWHVVLEALGERGAIDKLVSMAKVFEDNVDNLAESTAVFGPDDSDWKEDIPFQFYNIGIYLAEDGDPEYAKHCFDIFEERGFIALEEDPYASLYLALIHKRLGEDADSKRYLEIAREKLRKDGDTRLFHKIVRATEDTR